MLLTLLVIYVAARVLRRVTRVPAFLAVLGPTATGKSGLALALAERVGGEIVNCDSTAVYRGFDIGTDKVPLAERRGIPHHLIDIVDPTDEYTAADFARDASAAIRDIHARGRRADRCGRDRVLLPRVDTRAVSRAGARCGAASARSKPWPRGVDCRSAPAALARRSAVGRAHPTARPKRMVRALEVYFLTGEPLTAHFARHGVAACRSSRRCPWRSRCRRRNSSRAWRGAWTHSSRRASSTRCAACSRVGCRPMRGRSAGSSTARRSSTCGACVTKRPRAQLIVQENRRYARRQLIWFRKEPNLIWFDGPGESIEVQAGVIRMLAERGLLKNGRDVADG